jgi:Uma2 family endonuclease
MTTMVARRRMSLAEFLALPDDGVEWNLIRGKVWEKPKTWRNRRHSRIEAQIAYLLESWLEKQSRPRGAIHSGNTGCILSQGPDTMVGIDVIYLSAGLAAQEPDDTQLIDGVPTLAVEILSPSNTEEEVNAKVDEYRRVGVPLVWLVDPHLETVCALRPDAPPQLYSVGQDLTAEPHLPGFCVPVAAIFER